MTLMDDLKSASPFFIPDFCKEHSQYKDKTVWNYIKYHHELFDCEKVQENKVGRPKNKYTVKPV